ncbi:energy transducer TonB [Christiangramia sp. SM2212]|uniref:Energy transducer TonB n=1 Tax=Christiangramia sediminicola TaxID=3073267 RepID=A0ABU1ELW7_9FLAO|nr:energy transducer TonB [Christiangramia sp. SM2212]MDR5589381.1 energy transducer TonB [Christiangramia sp. SM2212]
MKPKKNPKADLRRRWVLFLQIGLILILFTTLQAFQWKTYDEKSFNDPKIGMDVLEEETPPVVITPEITPPPPPKTIVDVIEEIPDDSDIEEDPVKPTEIDLDDILEPSDIEEPETPDDEPINVPFDFIEDVPIFPGCESLTDNNERKSCMSSKISKFVNKEFNTALGGELGLTGANLVLVMFVVNKEGEVEQIQTRAPHPELEKEARRVIGELPKMKPGKQRGKPVPVSYTIPIRFKVQE